MHPSVGAGFNPPWRPCPRQASSRRRRIGAWNGRRYGVKSANSISFSSEPMSIKSDKWIRRMARETGMIEPFEPGQVKEADGHRIVSYGTSSYGYDIRCADEFKLFTNINTTIVDPKNFDQNNFVDVSGK